MLGFDEKLYLKYTYDERTKTDDEEKPVLNKYILLSQLLQFCKALKQKKITHQLQ